MPRLLAALTTALFACACALPGPALAAKQTYFRVGNAVDAAAETTAGTVLMGGSTDVDAAFEWLCARAAGGDFLVVRRIVAGESFNVADWKGNAGTAYTVTADAGVLSSSQPGGSVYWTEGVRG